MNRRIAFIINPVAGTKNKNVISETIREHIPDSVHYEIMMWNEKSGFPDLWEEVKQKQFDTAVAVGGDGTVNEVARAVSGTNLKLGIIPIGSGNGLARTLGISLKTHEAVETILQNKTRSIDCATINDRAFFCTSGLGFDAHIGNLFAKDKNRGLMGYVKITLKELFSYKPQQYRISLNGETFTRDAFLITFANAGQYGNDFYIAPEAKVDDGLLHVVVFKPFSLMMSPLIALRFLRKKAHQSHYIETFTAKEISVLRVKEGAIHFDGEPDETGHEINVKLVRSALNVLV